jgi:hypothetical protein
VRRRALLAALLVYVTLDLSLPAMPGAFVFDVADSVESLKSSRGREAADVMVRAQPAGAVPVLARPVLARAPDGVADVVRALHPPPICAKCFPRAALAVGAPVRRAEDPH